MRRKIHIKIGAISKVFLIFLFILFSFNILVTKQTSAEPGENLEIVVQDEVDEEEFFFVSVMDPEILEDSPWLIDVIIEFDGRQYKINDSAEVEIQAPQVNQDKEYIIIASKEGYNPSNKTIIVRNFEIVSLFISHDDFVVDAGERFSITVTENDKNGKPVVGVRIAIQSFGQPAFTDDNGRAWLTAPEDWEKITILASQSESHSSSSDNSTVWHMKLRLLKKEYTNRYTRYFQIG